MKKRKAKRQNQKQRTANISSPSKCGNSSFRCASFRSVHLSAWQESIDQR